MINSVPSGNGHSRLQVEANKKISGLQAIEKSFPGALIIYNLKTSGVEYMSEWGRTHLKVSMEELHQMGKAYHSRFFNPDDAKEYVPKILGLLERNNDDEFISCFQQVRPSPQHDWAWYLSSTKIFFRDEEGAPLLTLTMALPVDSQHHMAAKAERLLEENNFLRNQHHIFNELTRREKEILAMMAKGISSGEMACRLHISEMTATTHRRNIKRKLKIESNYDIIRFAQAFDLI
jgi:DNA-binding CsgD family transcriptional regulator